MFLIGMPDSVNIIFYIGLCSLELLKQMLTSSPRTLAKDSKNRNYSLKIVAFAI